MKKFQVVFQYDEPAHKWDVFVIGAASPTEALQGFNSAIITAQDATPSLECNKAELMPTPESMAPIYKIHVGIHDALNRALAKHWPKT